MIMTTTLVGRGCADVVGDAIASTADWADAHLLIDTGGDSGAMETAVAAAGDRAATATFPWIDDYSAARNFALDEATRRGATWAVTLDPDERLRLNAATLLMTLGSSSAGCLLLPEQSGRYAKERFFRLPCDERFSGIVHEAFAAYRVGSKTLPAGHFEELPKAPDTLASKSRREVEMLRRQIAATPQDPRWRYYLADSLERVGDIDGAIDAYADCVRLRGWAEEAAWACYRAAQCLLERGEFDAAIEWCATGLGRLPGMPELPWTAALAAFRSGRHREAVAWARMAESLGDYAGCRASEGRIGFRYPSAAYEGPYDVLRFALAALGDDAGAEQAGREFETARAARVGLRSPTDPVPAATPAGSHARTAAMEEA